MKQFIVGALFVLATFFPIVFIPLLVLTLVISLLVTPYVLKHGMDWSDPKTKLNEHADG